MFGGNGLINVGVGGQRARILPVDTVSNRLLVFCCWRNRHDRRDAGRSRVGASEGQHS